METPSKNTQGFTPGARPVHSQHTSNMPSVTRLAIVLGVLASLGGFMMGFAIGSIGGFLVMPDFSMRFLAGEAALTKTGAIVGMLPAGALFGALGAGKLADSFGRRLPISGSAVLALVGTTLEISSSTTWIQFAAGRFIFGGSIGLLSVLVPMYQAESSPVHIRGVLVSSYQLFITIGILSSNIANFGTSSLDSAASWRITEAIAFVAPVVLGVGIMLLPESPAHAFRTGRAAEARITIAKLAGIDPASELVDGQINELSRKLEEDMASANVKWTEIFTGPRMAYRTVLGIVLQAGQQLTGVNFFFYYGSFVFHAVGLDDSYITSMILSSVNVLTTVAALYIVNAVGRRKVLISGALVMSACFVVYASIGHTFLGPDADNKKAPGVALIAVSCIFIAAFATTWGPVVWTVTAELYPAKYRGHCMALATASNWLCNFLIGFFTSYINAAIGYLYGLVFAGSCLALAFIVYFFLVETKDRSLEEIDQMHLMGVKPRTSAKWERTEVELQDRQQSASQDGSRNS